jgi:hypothetical protein
MAYKQTPGRGNQAKTGRGIPAPFRQTPDYARENKRENDAINSGDTMGAVKGASYTAGRMLTNFPAQAKHLKKNEMVSKDASGKVTGGSWETKVDAQKAVEQMQVARDSTQYLGNERDPMKRKKLGNEFNIYWSPNNKYNKKEQDRTGKGYQGPDGISGTNKDRYETLNKLRMEGIVHGGFGTKEDVPEKEFGLKPAPAPAKANPKSGAVKKKSPMKQTKAKVKEESFLDKAGKAVSGTVSTVKRGLMKADAALRRLEGPSGDSRYGDVGDTAFGVKLSGNKAGKKVSPAKQTTSRQKSMNQPMAKSTRLGKTTADMGEGPKPSNKNPKSGSNTIGGRSLEKNGIRGTKYEPGKRTEGMDRVYKDSPAKMMNKKTPAKMKKC